MSLIEAVHSRTLDGADMHKHIFAAIAWLDEAKALLDDRAFTRLVQIEFGKIISPTLVGRRGQLVSAEA